MIENKISLEDLINCFMTIKDSFDSFMISKIISKKDIEDMSFLKWDNLCDDPVYLEMCFCKDCAPDETFLNSGQECSKIALKYYVNQEPPGIEGDSFYGVRVYPCNAYFVFINYSM